MGFYFNPSNRKFASSLRSEIYVDKSGIIANTNEVLDTEQKYICISRPRRFGKTMAANMLAAYYSRGCDSYEMFINLNIAKDPSFKENLNKYNVIFLNMQEFLSESSNIENMLEIIKDRVISDILEVYTEINMNYTKMSLAYILQIIFRISKIPIVFIIDEWDCIFREYQKNETSQEFI